MRRLLGSIRLWPSMVVITAAVGIALAFNGVPQALIMPAWVALYGVFRRARRSEIRRPVHAVEREPGILAHAAQLRSARRQAF